MPHLVDVTLGADLEIHRDMPAIIGSLQRMRFSPSVGARTAAMHSNMMSQTMMECSQCSSGKRLRSYVDAISGKLRELTRKRICAIGGDFCKLIRDFSAPPSKPDPLRKR
jgi:hypothetical protein